MTSQRWFLAALGIVLGGLSQTGCGPNPGPELVDVQGKVTYKGKAVPGGEGVFQIADGNNRGVGRINADGSYKMKSPLGKVRAAVVTRPATQDRSGDANRPAVRDVVLPRGVNPAQLPPPRYESFNTSGLSYEVKDSSNTI